MNQPACSHASHQTAPITINPVFVNGEEISEQDIAQEVQYHPADNPEEAVYLATQALVIKLLLNQQIKKQQLPIEQRTEESEEEAAIRTLLEQEVDIPTASEQECKQIYATNPERFTSPPVMAVKHILLAAAPEDTPARMEAKQQAENIIKELTNEPALFNELALAYSACPSKESGGDLGQISKGQTTPEFERQVFKLAPGLSPRPIETRYGYHVVWVTAKAEGQPLSYEQVETKIKSYLQTKVRLRAIQQYLAILVAEANIKGIEINLEDAGLL
ncbi:peptidylprolyl isomerase [Spartinivicinus poritis]|uniref:peptidylprolyl isomerase n=1 Tax=Spartinivicinus poritis TaxID=2994640 RepID=A0ABT5U9L3_9GAMM|nr:peptidylprolyl isomerase [Spartinivicinus sp. A2-2]MDE1462870.1 peptidylprolyl isomerase [Spartinivicinus sp. A2-2]